jgi:hypothetical protein
LSITNVAARFCWISLARTKTCGPQICEAGEEEKGVRMIRKVEMERFTVISARPFDEVVAALQDFDRKSKYG